MGFISQEVACGGDTLWEGWNQNHRETGAMEPSKENHEYGVSVFDASCKSMVFG